MIELTERPKWQKDAACRGLGPELFFPALGVGKGAPGLKSIKTKELKALCAGCPVRTECIEYALDEHHGFWGATSPKQRMKMRSGTAA